MANIAKPKTNSYKSTPETALIFLRSTTTMTIGQPSLGTDMFSTWGMREGIYGNSDKNTHETSIRFVSEAVIRNLFSTDDFLDSL